MAVVIHIKGLTGSLQTLSFPGSTRLGDVLFALNQKDETKIRRNKYLHKKQLLETHGLCTPLSQLAEDGEMTIYFVLRLEAPPPTFGLLMIDYISWLDQVVNARQYDPLLDVHVRLRCQLFDELRKMYGNTNPPVNDVDPITLEHIKHPVRWIENGRVFAMEYDSLKTYVAKFAYLDEQGVRQIPNPLTRQPIVDPWRYDFLSYVKW